jgi:AcrR family transcriptional regulator
MQANSRSARPQLIEGLCLSVEEKGYAATTIADIVRHARVSKRTFYEAFADKEECFLAAYRELSDQTMQAVATVVDADEPWERQIERAVRAYLSTLEARPALTRTFLLEIQAAGARALGLRREILQQFAELTRGFVEEARRRRPELKRMTPAMAMAIVGGINELMLLKVERAARLGDLADTAVELVRAVVAPPAATTGRRAETRRTS